mmetsp:Transcript_18938/g.43954  ORF Transcript_18938/g.43954 Transcript_18938/m.43954 type:complete len:132 (+) Transcript_18938:1302-1697(+)
MAGWLSRLDGLVVSRIDQPDIGEADAYGDCHEGSERRMKQISVISQRLLRCSLVEQSRGMIIFDQMEYVTHWSIVAYGMHRRNLYMMSSRSYNRPCNVNYGALTNGFTQSMEQSNNNNLLQIEDWVFMRKP